MESTITVQQLNCQINLPDGTESRAAVTAMLERIARRELARACAGVLEETPGEEEVVYRIRRLRLDLWVDAQGMTEAEITGRWGALLAQAVMQAVRSGRDVMRFESPRHFLTAFLRELLQGGAWNCWYFDEFHPLRDLPAPAICVEMITARPDWAAPILQDLDGTGLIERWRAEDIEQVWAALGPARLEHSPERLSVLLALRPATGGGPSRLERARARLRLWLALASAQPDTARDPVYLGLAAVLGDLPALLRAEPELAPLLAMGTPIYPALRRRIETGPLADTLAWIDAAPPSLLAEIVEAVERAPAKPLELASEVGGVFLLLPALVDLGLWELWREEVDEDTARRWLFVVAMKTLGAERAPLMLGDPLLSALAGLGSPPVADARIYRAADGPLGAWVGRLRASAEARYPQLATAQGAARGVHVLKNSAAGVWLAAGPHPFEGDYRSLEGEEQTALEAEIRHFQLPHHLGYPWLTPSLNAALSAVASQAIRLTASRLPGLSRSGAIYTARMFLAQPARLRIGGDGLQVQLAGGPLKVVLQMAGLPWSIRAPWLPGSVQIDL